jgi:hypothetical protein
MAIKEKLGRVENKNKAHMAFFLAVQPYRGIIDTTKAVKAT